LGFQFRDLPPGSTAASVADCTIPRFSKRSCFGRQVPLASTTRGSPLAAKGETMGEKWWPNGAWDMHPGFFYMPQICDMGADLVRNSVTYHTLYFICTLLWVNQFGTLPSSYAIHSSYQHTKSNLRLNTATSTITDQQKPKT